ncbi:UPF0739 protein C1orf74-like protein [Triplophysa rosa]|uniref:UPF0739 protein C1orf74-like protein n=2 Tax=Triplophysa rosa TaxID=992332 RepID=A0A9W7WT79_TRIRA|nr:UPF0739 protein C1orf74-like protein [Triplophysa rosa]
MVASISTLVAAAQKLLCVGRKRLSSSKCLNLTVQLMAVDLGVKHALLYDCNAASPEQVYLFLNSLPDLGIITNELRMFSIDDNIIIFNPATMESHLDELLQNKSLFLIDVSPSRKQHVLTGIEKRTEDMIRSILGLFRNEVDESSSVIVVEEKVYNEWNLCTLFGILLGYPATYWFDQTKGFGNCLSMTPLTLSTVQVKWEINDIKHCCCLYSFSIPEELWVELESRMKWWIECLRERFKKQTVLTDLCFSRETVSLPAVTL